MPKLFDLPVLIDTTLPNDVVEIRTGSSVTRIVDLIRRCCPACGKPESAQHLCDERRCPSLLIERRIA